LDQQQNTLALDTPPMRGFLVASIVSTITSIPKDETKKSQRYVAGGDTAEGRIVVTRDEAGLAVVELIVARGVTGAGGVVMRLNVDQADSLVAALDAVLSINDDLAWSKEDIKSLVSHNRVPLMFGTIREQAPAPKPSWFQRLSSFLTFGGTPA
jgi:hypothetical protein